MSNAYRKVVRRRPRKNRHGDLVKRVAEQTGVSIWMVYKVLAKQAKSARVERAIDQVRRELAA